MASEDQLITEYFMMFDTDGDQKIEKKELRTLLRVVYKETPDESVLEKCLQQYDTDGSGTIDLEEFKKLYKAMPIKPKGLSLKELFNRYDKNGDGDLEIAEVKQFLQDLGECSTDDVVERLMHDVDVDKDGRVDFKEFCIMFGRSVTETS